MTTMENAERAERRARQRELADRLKASGALDQIFEQIDAGEVPLGGDDGLLKGMLRAALERGLEVELTDHVGYERGDPEASLFPNSRNGTSAKTVSSEVGDVELAVPRDRHGSFTPQLVPKGSRRLGGLDEMIISLYAGGMTLRDIQHHLVSTIGTELSHETISKITDQVAEEVLVWQRRPLEALYPVIYLDALVVKVKTAPTSATRLPMLPSGWTWTASSTPSGAGTGSGCRSPVVPTRATGATTAPQNRSPPAHASRPATAHCSTMPSTRPQYGYPSRLTAIGWHTDRSIRLTVGLSQHLL